MSEHLIEKYWKEIVNTINDGLLIVGSDGIIQSVNSAMEKLTGFTTEEMLGKPCSIFKCDGCEQARAESKEKWCLLFDLERVTSKRCIITRKDGSYLPVFKRASILRDAEGKTLGSIETIMDISELDKKEQEIESLSRLLDMQAGFHGMIGKSPLMQRTYSIIRKAALSDAPVLILGATGTGKELVARAIHELGRRRDGPYIELNCAALNEALLESELFGHVKGAFTGAFRHRQGRFEAAHGGDIFLDEIGDVPLSTQVKLLRVLETKQFERVGDQQPMFTDVRIICATNRKLDQLVAEKKFREDLLFRINVIPIYLPPLSQRMSDVPLLVERLVHDLRGKTGKKITGLSPAAMKLFMNYGWPGNVRELKSALEYAFVIAEKGLIEPDHLPVNFTSERDRTCVAWETKNSEAAERDALIAALRESGGNKSHAAKKLGVSRVTVWNRIRKYGLDLPRILLKK